MVRFRFVLMMPWNWKACRVVSLIVPLANCVADPVHFQPLRRGGDSAGHADADHEAVSLLQLVLAATLAQVAVVLLVGAVKFEELLVILAHGAGGKIGKPLHNGSAKIVAAGLDAFVGR